MALSRLAFVAETRKTSTLALTPPTGRTVQSSSRRRSTACSATGISPISSRKSVPPSASLTSPMAPPRRARVLRRAFNRTLRMLGPNRKIFPRKRRIRHLATFKCRFRVLNVVIDDRQAAPRMQHYDGADARGLVVYEIKTCVWKQLFQFG